MRMIPMIPQRECGDCTACCEGWLDADVHGEMMYKGKPCHYIQEKGCSIYDHRPIDPCVQYRCLWIQDKSVPGWLKPNKCGAIISLKEKENIWYLEAVEMGKKLDSSVLSWLIMETVRHGKNICYEINSGRNYIGNKEFLDMVSKFSK